MTTSVLRAVAPPTVAEVRRIYVAGPMNGIADFNYPAFHAATRDLQARGLVVESPAGHATSGATLEVQIADSLSMLVRPLHVWQAWLVAA